MNFNEHNIGELIHTFLYVISKSIDKSYDYISKVLYKGHELMIHKIGLNLIDDHFIVRDGIPRSSMIDLALKNDEVPKELEKLKSSISFNNGKLMNLIEPDIDWISQYCKDLLDSIINTDIVLDLPFSEGKIISPIDIVKYLNEGEDFVNYVKEKYYIDMYLELY